MRINMNGKFICEMEPIEATQRLTQDELFWYSDNCFKLSSPFHRMKEKIVNVSENIDGFREMVRDKIHEPVSKGEFYEVIYETSQNIFCWVWEWL
jgi:hypothetical protein